jgi:hypothetical protein
MTPDIWAVYGRHPEALIGFAGVETGQASKEIAEDEALDDGISRSPARCGYREEDTVEVVRRHRREKSLGRHLAEWRLSSSEDGSFATLNLYGLILPSPQVIDR